MTSLEAAYKYGTKRIVPTNGTTITDMVRVLYQSYDPKYYISLMALNHHVCWYSLSSTQVIRFLPKELFNEIHETVL